MKSSFKIANLLAVLGLATALAATCDAQISIGDDLKLSTATGIIGAGYTGNYGNLVDSSHSLDWNGSGNISGYYYNPNFLSFSVAPYYDQSRANSTSQALTNTSGVNFNSSIFNGSRFPGSVSYSKGFNSQGTFGVPGLPDFTTHGDNDSFGVGWSANLPDLPSVSTQLQWSHSAYSIYGTDSDGNSASHSFNIRSGYSLAGFSLNGGFSHAAANSDVPLLLAPGNAATSDVTSDTWNFNAGHRLPMRGNFSANFSRYSSDYNYSNEGISSGNSATDSYAGTASIQPWDKVSFSGSVGFDDNLGGTLTQQILNAGGTGAQIFPLTGSTSLSMIGQVAYQPFDDLALDGQVQRRVQSWLGVNFGVTSYTGLARYTRQLWGGSLGAITSVTGNREDNSQGTVLGFSDNITYSRSVGGWNFGGNFGYSQNVQTLLVTYMTSNYTAGGTVQRKIGAAYLSLSANTARSGMALQQGDEAASNSYSVGLNTGRYFSASASYQNSNGTAIQTITGLTPTPLPPVINPEAIVLYEGRSYAFSASTTPFRRFAFAATYSKSLSDTRSTTINSNIAFEQLAVTTHYQWRKMYFMGGYSQFVQGISVAGVPASRLSSFYIGVNRWFNWF
ncbi:MAG TPA: hypothetical protein VFU86_13150 [Terriglobales bacterium]|nr:hypothetical protein [Terriglobales bacterium]